MEEFKLKDAMDFIECMDRDYVGERSKVASMQRLLLQAARQGDDAAVRLYHQASEELGMMVGSIAKALWDGEEVRVSYSGGLFYAKEYVLPVLERVVREVNGTLTKPMFTPVQGAALMAMEREVNVTEVVEEWICH